MRTPALRLLICPSILPALSSKPAFIYLPLHLPPSSMAPFSSDMPQTPQTELNLCLLLPKTLHIIPISLHPVVLVLSPCSELDTALGVPVGQMGPEEHVCTGSKGLPTRETLCNQVCPSELGTCLQRVPVEHDSSTLAGGHATWGAQSWPACRFTAIPSSVEANLTSSYLGAKDPVHQCIEMGSCRTRT